MFLSKVLKDAHLYDNELPYWLAIGPICWSARYSPDHVYLRDPFYPDHIIRVSV